MPNPPALLLRGPMPTLCFAREPSAIPTPATAVSSEPNLNLSQNCCCVRVRAVCFFFFFCIASGDQKTRK